MHPSQILKMKSDDENYTPPSLIMPILKELANFKKRKGLDNVTIWCPFDLEKTLKIDGVIYPKSLYVKIFRDFGYNVIASHILTGQDFFEYEPLEHYDVIISNPPFKNKRLFFERAILFKKPFALVSIATWLNDNGVNNVFKDIDLQLLIPNNRVSFFTSEGYKKSRPSFKSIYYCYDFLDKPIKFCDVNIKHDEEFVAKFLDEIKKEIE